MEQYRRGLLRAGLRRLMEFEPGISYLPRELYRFGYLLSGILKLMNHLDKGDFTKGHSLSLNENIPRIELEKKSRFMTIDGQRVKAGKQIYMIVAYLMKRAPDLCSREELGKLLYGSKFKEGNVAVAMHRTKAFLEEHAAKEPSLLVSIDNSYGLNLND
jgi:DNA-binding response OmpR family regulator